MLPYWQYISGNPPNIIIVVMTKKILVNCVLRLLIINASIR